MVRVYTYLYNWILNKLSTVATIKKELQPLDDGLSSVDSSARLLIYETYFLSDPRLS